MMIATNLVATGLLYKPELYSGSDNQSCWPLCKNSLHLFFSFHFYADDTTIFLICDPVKQFSENLIHPKFYLVSFD